VRIQQFITALQQNQYIAPEPGGSCDQPGFLGAAPAFDATKPGADAVAMSGAGLTADTTEVATAGAPASGAATSGAATSGAAASKAPASGTPSASKAVGTAPATTAAVPSK
jgi:hypothetical protein